MVGLVGLRWATERDVIFLEPKPLYFGKMRRSRRPPAVDGNVKEALAQHFTRQTLLGKDNGVFDPIGIVTPITAQLKNDLHELINLKLGLDELVPEELLPKWVR